jgi:type IV pilus assembly protein PilB
MGIEPFLVSSSVVLILAQRLVRRLCQNCKEPLAVSQDALLDFGLTDEEAEGATLYKGRGCDRCGGKGYSGRVALYEVMPVSDELRDLIVRGASHMELREQSVIDGMNTLRRSGVKKAMEGFTTLEEVSRVTMGD